MAVSLQCSISFHQPAFLLILLSCYSREEHEGYESIHEKLPMETVFTSSLVTGIVLAIITWLIVTFVDCLKRSEKDELTTWGLFKKEVFSKNTGALTILIGECKLNCVKLQ